MLDSFYMDTNTDSMGKQIAIWATVFIGTGLIIAGMIFMAQRNQNAATDRIKNVAIEYAKSLQLNIDQFTTDFDSAELKNKIQTKIKDGQSIPISYTPTFFVNGTRINNPGNYEALKTLINQTFAGTPVPVSDDGELKIADFINDNDWVRGDRKSKVVITEYSDFQRPACGAYFPIVEQAHDEFGDKIAFVYRHFPLVNLHPYAEPMARAAEAAGKQGKFFEMYSLIFTNQTKWAK